MSRPIAFVRSVPDSFSAALSGAPQTVAIDVSAARAQHAQYVDSLAGGGFRVEQLPTPEDYPDGPFIEDTAVLLLGTLVLTRPGAPSRRGEVAGVAAALADRFEIRSIEPPGTLEGGDVLRIGQQIYVGRSARTNDDGIQQLAAFAAQHSFETVPVPVQKTLHLKSVVTALDEDTLVGTRGHFEPEVFGGRRLLWVTGEPEVNVLKLPDGRFLVPASKRAVHEVLAGAGLTVVTVDVSEFEKADGGLTCLSLRTDGS